MHQHLRPRTSPHASHLTPHDQAVLTLGIDADLRSVFNWNVKQLFVYVTAEYETDANVLNQVVVWDTIINDSPSVRAPVDGPRPSCPRDSASRRCSQHSRSVFSIVSPPLQAWIRSSQTVNKYSLTDQGYGLKGNNVSLVLNWNTVPSTGLLTLSHGWSDINEVTLPEKYS